jgi:hypothetical protein
VYSGGGLMPRAPVVGVRLLGPARAVRADREAPLGVLRLVPARRANPQIGADTSPKTANAHVNRILCKLGVSSRVQAAAPAERAGLRQAGEHKVRRAGFKGDGQVSGPDRRSARW